MRIFQVGNHNQRSNRVHAVLSVGVVVQCTRAQVHTNDVLEFQCCLHPSLTQTPAFLFFSSLLFSFLLFSSPIIAFLRNEKKQRSKRIRYCTASFTAYVICEKRRK